MLQDQFEKVFGMFGQTKELSREIQKEKSLWAYLEGLCVEVRCAEKMSGAADRAWGRVRGCWEPSQSWSTHLSRHYKLFPQTWNNSSVFYHLVGFFGVKNLVRDWLSTSGCDLPQYIWHKKPQGRVLQG